MRRPSIWWVISGNVLSLGSWCLTDEARIVAAGAGVVVLTVTLVRIVRYRRWRKAAAR